jgi:predicted DNA-binding transcriptional regulator AlpA
MDQLLEPGQVAELLSVTEKRLTEWRYLGRGPDYVKLGHRTVRYRLADVQSWVDSHLATKGEK